MSRRHSTFSCRATMQTRAIITIIIIIKQHSNNSNSNTANNNSNNDNNNNNNNSNSSNRATSRCAESNPSAPGCAISSCVALIVRCVYMHM